MTEKKDKTKVEYGEFNKLYDNKDVRESINLDSENFVTLSRKTIKNNFVNSDIKQGRYMGFVLQVHEEKNDSGGIFGGLFSSPTWTAVVRIPEFDAHLPEPLLVGEAALKSENKDMGELRSQDVIDMHTTYAPQKPEDMEKPEPGNKVWVSKSSGKPIILEIISSKSGDNNVDIEGAKKPNPKKAYKGGTGGVGYVGEGGGGATYAGSSSTLPKYVLKGERLKNAKLIAQAVLDEGGTDVEAANIVAMCQGESGLKPIVEGCYTNTSVSRVRAAMGGRVKDKTDEELEVLKKDCVAFFDHCYRGPVGSDWYNKNNKDTARGGYKYRGRGFHQATGISNYTLCGRAIKEDLVNKPELLEQAPIAAKALAWYYYRAWGSGGKRKTVRGRALNYSEFESIYALTWGGWADAQKRPDVKKHRMDDVAKRKTWASGWLDFIRRNITKTVPLDAPVSGTTLPGSTVPATRQDIAQNEQLKVFLDGYHNSLASLEEKAILTPEEKTNGLNKSPQLEPEELSKLIQFPMFGQHNMIAPIQGVPGKILGADFDQPRGKYQHASYDQYVEEGKYKVRAMCDAVAYVSNSSANFDNTQKTFQNNVKQILLSKDAKPFRDAHAKRKIASIDSLAQRIESGSISTNRLGSMSWQEFRAWGKQNMTNNALASLLRNDQSLGLPSGGMGVTFTTPPDHNGLVYKYYYGHLNELYVKSGESVKMGQVVGVAGSTSIFDSKAHLHFQMEGPHNAPYYKKPNVSGRNLKLRMPPSTLVPSFARGAKYSPIYSTAGAYVSYQKSSLPAEVVAVLSPEQPQSDFGPYKPLEPYTENRVRISQGFEPIVNSNDPRLISAPTIPGKTVQKIHVLTHHRFLKLSEAAVEAGFDTPLLASGWRTKRYSTKEQYDAAMIEKYGSVAEGRKWIAYESPHMTGLAIDFGNNGLYPKSSTNSQQKQTPFFKWLKENAHRFGFTPYRREAWHWEVKVPIDAYASGNEFSNNYRVLV